MRVYIPFELQALARLRDEGGIAHGVTAFAVTATLREWYAQSDTDELEHAAFLDAARRSLSRVGVSSEIPRLRVVLSADVPDGAVTPVEGEEEDDRSVVLVSGSVPLAALASIHVDEDAAEPAVAAVVAALGRTGILDAAAQDDLESALDEAEGHDLLWYDVTELDDILDRYDPRGELA
jgi:hypothetical protein